MIGRLQEKVALVVGAGSVGPGWGNGKAAAVLFAREGAKVLCADVNEDAANETVQIIHQENGTANAICADVTTADYRDRGSAKRGCPLPARLSGVMLGMVPTSETAVRKWVVSELLASEATKWRLLNRRSLWCRSRCCFAAPWFCSEQGTLCGCPSN
jgi:hypothetical protein